MLGLCEIVTVYVNRKRSPRMTCERDKSIGSAVREKSYHEWKPVETMVARAVVVVVVVYLIVLMCARRR